MEGGGGGGGGGYSMNKGSGGQKVGPNPKTSNIVTLENLMPKISKP